MLYWIIRAIAVLACKILFRIKVFGKKNIPKKRGFILVSNHLSYLDPVVLGVACPRKLNFMAKHDLFYNPLFSWFISELGAFAVKRESADISALKEAIKRLKNGNALLIFPEGSRSVNRISTQPQAGVGFLAAKLDVPVIPAFIKGTDACWGRGTKFIKPLPISVYFGKQISLERRRPYQALASDIMRSIRQLSCPAYSNHP